MSVHTGSIFPSPDTLNGLEYGKFVLSNLAAKRAKQIKDGAPPLVRIDSSHPLSIALAEIAAGKIKPIVREADGVIEAVDLTPIDVTGNELGILLPALDDSEAEILGVVGLGDDEHEDELDLEGSPATLGDLLGDEVTEVEVAESDDDTLSLSDIAEQENEGAEDEDETAV